MTIRLERADAWPDPPPPPRITVVDNEEPTDKGKQKPETELHEHRDAEKKAN